MSPPPQRHLEPAPQPETERVGTIFIVDDEMMVTSSLKTMLILETAHEVHCFNAPADALARVAELRPEVVISDFSMPEMDGITFLCKVKELLPEATLILLTGYSDKESAIKAINTAGIYRYIEKPWDNEELKLSIKNGLERTHLVSDLRQSVQQLTEAREQLEATNLHLEHLVEERTADLRATYRKLQSIVQNTADGIMTLSPSLELSSLNPASEKWLARHFDKDGGGKPWLLANLNIKDFLQVPDEKDIQQIFTRLQAPASEIAGEQTNVLVKEARIGGVPLEVSIARVPDEGGYVLVLRDITQRKEIERLRDDFVSTLTHDLRTPLLAAIQTLGFFVDGTLEPLSDKQNDLVTMLIHSHREMLGLVNVLLEVYKYEAGRQRLIFDQVDVGALVQLVCKELDALAQSREQTICIELPDRLGSVVGDKQELRRVFMNLVGNAINYTPAGGAIQVTVQEETLPAVAGQASTQRIVVRVQDNGRGIPAQDLPTLFQRFSQGTSSKRSSGSGLGLYLSRQIVEAHQGVIGVESEVGKGSCFTVTLPLGRAQA